MSGERIANLEKMSERPALPDNVSSDMLVSLWAPHIQKSTVQFVAGPYHVLTFLYPGLFILSTFYIQDLLYPGPFISRAFYIKDLLYPGTFLSRTFCILFIMHPGPDLLYPDLSLADLLTNRRRHEELLKSRVKLRVKQGSPGSEGLSL